MPKIKYNSKDILRLKKAENIILDTAQDHRNIFIFLS